MRAKNGFTLIELLVVIAIIAILAAILFPLLAKARQQANIAACTSNMKQFGLAITLHREDNRGNLPRARNIWWPAVWNGGWYDRDGKPTKYNYLEQLDKYMKSNKVAICPAKPDIEIERSLVPLWQTDGQFRSANKSKWWGAVYTMSAYDRATGAISSGSFASIGWADVSGPLARAVTNLDSFPYETGLNSTMSQTMLLFCMAGTWKWSWGQDARWPDGFVTGAHERGTPALFCDMHVKFVTKDMVGNL